MSCVNSHRWRTAAEPRSLPERGRPAALLQTPWRPAGGAAVADWPGVRGSCRTSIEDNKTFISSKTNVLQPAVRVTKYFYSRVLSVLPSFSLLLQNYTLTSARLKHKHLSRFVFETFRTRNRLTWEAAGTRPQRKSRSSLWILLKGTVQLTIKHFSLGVFCCCFSFRHVETDAAARNKRRQTCLFSLTCLADPDVQDGRHTVSFTVLVEPTCWSSGTIHLWQLLPGQMSHTVPTSSVLLLWFRFSEVFFLFDADFSSSWLF